MCLQLLRRSMCVVLRSGPRERGGERVGKSVILFEMGSLPGGCVVDEIVIVPEGRVRGAEKKRNQQVKAQPSSLKLRRLEAGGIN